MSPVGEGMELLKMTVRLSSPFIVTGGQGLSATGPDERDTGNLNPVN